MNDNMHTHYKPKNVSDLVAFSFTKLLRLFADLFFKKRYGHRAVILETVAAVPGMVAGMLNHLKSLRKMQNDNGWIKTLLDEAENERMHLMTFIEIEIAPLAFMRGRTLKNCFAILDEAQNATETQIKMFLTRIGENSKLVVNGDPSQVDLINKTHSGLIKSRNILNEIKEIKIIEFDHNDVVRHPLVSKIIRAYEDKSADDKN